MFPQPDALPGAGLIRPLCTGNTSDVPSIEDLIWKAYRLLPHSHAHNFRCRELSEEKTLHVVAYGGIAVLIKCREAEVCCNNRCSKPMLTRGIQPADSEFHPLPDETHEIWR